MPCTRLCALHAPGQDAVLMARSFSRRHSAPDRGDMNGVLPDEQQEVKRRPHRLPSLKHQAQGHAKSDEAVEGQRAPRYISQRTSAMLHLNVHAKHLESYSIFKGCSAEFLCALGLFLEERQFQAGTDIITQGELGDYMYFLNFGKVAVAVGDCKVSQLEAPTVFGEMAVLSSAASGARHSATIRAVTMCLCFVVERQVLLQLFSSFPEEMQIFTAMSDQRLQALIEKGLSPKLPEHSWKPKLHRAVATLRRRRASAGSDTSYRQEAPERVSTCPDLPACTDSKELRFWQRLRSDSLPDVPSPVGSPHASQLANIPDDLKSMTAFMLSPPKAVTEVGCKNGATEEIADPVPPKERRGRGRRQVHRTTWAFELSGFQKAGDSAKHSKRNQLLDMYRDYRPTSC